MTSATVSIGSFCQSPVVMLYQVGKWVCHTITTHWQEMAMVAGIVCAVVGAVVAFFQSMPLLACAFLFFGAVSAAGLAFMQQINAIRKLEKEILGGMQKENEKLKASTIALEKTNIELKTTTGELKQTKNELEETVQQLKAENGKQKKDFDESNQKLSAQVIELTTAVASLSGLGEHIKDDVKESVKNTKDAQEILFKLKQHVEKAQLVFEQVKKQFNVQDQTFTQRIDELKKFFSAANVKNCMQELVNILKDINKQNAEHKELIKEYARFKDEFGREKGLLEEIRKKLELLHPLLQDDERGINKGVKQLQDGVDALTRLLGAHVDR